MTYTPAFRNRSQLLMILSAIYLLSGFSALIYQILWIRKFSLLFGSTVFAMSVVIAVFFAGLAIGSFVFGRISISVKNPVRLYAVVEILIGVYALAFPWILHLAEGVYHNIYMSSSQSFAYIMLVRAIIATIVLLTPTVLMGGTLPVLARYFVKKLALTGERTGLIYGLNALGAALGSFTTGYLLLPNIGVAKTNIAAAIVNIIIGVAAFILSTYSDALSEENETVVQKTGKNLKKIPSVPDYSGLSALIIACFAVSGFISMAYEMIWLRYLVFFFRDTSYLYTGIITVFVLGIGIGSLVYRRFESRINANVAFFGLLQISIGLSTVLAIYLPVGAYQTIYEAGEKSGVVVLMLLFVLLIIPTMIMGATFPVASKILTNDISKAGAQIGKAYAFNTSGAVLGALAGGFFLFSFIGIQNTLCLLLGVNTIMAAVLIYSDKSFSGANSAVASLSIGLLSAAFLAFVPAVHLPELILNKKITDATEILEVKEGATGTAWATKGEDSVVKLWHDSITISKGSEGGFLTQGFIPLLIAQKIPERVLGLTFGGGLSYYAARLFPEVRRMDFVDISRENIDIAIEHFPENAGISSDPRVTFHIDDAYNFLKYGSTQYDLILMEPTPPMFSFRTAALYTREFYDLGRKRLSDGGYFVQIVPLGNMSDMETMSTMKTFSSVFRHCLLWWNERDCLMIGANHEISLDLREINNRLNRPVIQESLKKYSQKGQYQFIGNFLSGILLVPDDFRTVAASGTVYTDDLPGLEFSSGRDITPANTEMIHSNLSSWVKVKGLFYDFPDFDKYVVLLNGRREYLMALLYSDTPDIFYRRFLNYIDNHSQNKANDLNLLHAYLLRYGMIDRAEEVRKRIRP